MRSLRELLKMWPDPRMKETISSLWRERKPATPVISGLGMDFDTGQSVKLGLPSTINSATTNSLTATSHTHELGNVAIGDVTQETVEYGGLYNWWAATDVRKIANTGWHLPASVDFENLKNYLGGADAAGIKLKEIGNVYWNSPNAGSTNEVGFNGRGSGYRSNTGIYSDIKNSAMFFSTDEWLNTGNILVGGLFYNFNFFDAGQIATKGSGITIRLLKDDGIFTPTMTGNDGKVYKCVQIGTQIWLAENLNETKYRNGDWINGFNGGVYTPITNANWSLLTTGAMCYYADNIANGGGQTPLTGIITGLQSKSHLPVTIDPVSAAYASINGNQQITLPLGSIALKAYWSGTLTAYNAITPKLVNTIYFIEE